MTEAGKEAVMKKMGDVDCAAAWCKDIQNPLPPRLSKQKTEHSTLGCLSRVSGYLSGLQSNTSIQY